MYQVLYRKWRPQKFSDVAGQPQVTRTLENELKSGRINHAYLFTGTRGTGKTSAAKILARAVNCEHPENGNPCGECSVCRNITDGTSMNVIEIDGHDTDAIAEAYRNFIKEQERPTAIIANTIKGKGVSFMEDQAGWHGKAPNKEQYEQAMAELEGNE